MERPVRQKRKAPEESLPQKRPRSYRCLKCAKRSVEEHVCRSKTGILNAGNTCYINAVLQVLADLQIPLLVPNSSELLSLYQKLNEFSLEPLSLTPVLMELSDVWTHHDHQEDAHEFFLAMLALCESSVFNFEVHTSGHCVVCQTVAFDSYKHDNTFHMMLDGVPLQEQMEHPVEVIEAECVNCGLVPHKLKKQIKSKPGVLVVKMNRFLFNPKTERANKIRTRMELPQEIWVAGERMELSSVIMHKGKAVTHGHYVTYIHDKEIEIDDEQVTYGQRFNLDHSYFYVAFYR